MSTVPDFIPFPAVRFALRSSSTATSTDLGPVCSPPYDVIEPPQRAELAASDPHNMVHLVLPDSYEAAADALAAWEADGTLVRDAVDTFSVYRMTFTDDDGARIVTTGVIGALALDEGGVLPHERTLPKAKSDRLELLRATRANLEPIWAVSLATGLTDLCASDGPPDATALDEDGALHELWIVADQPRIDALRTAVAGHTLVLADGHHRYETSKTYRDEHPDDPGAAFIMMLVVELSDDLRVRAIHRLLHGTAAVDLRDALAGSFRVQSFGENTSEGVAKLEHAMRVDGGLGLVDRDGLALLVPTDALDEALAEGPAALRDVDSARFDAGVRPVVPDATLAYRNDGQAVAAVVRDGAADAAVLLRPVSVASIRAAADAAVRMPEKTTFFTPKPRTGMVLRTLD